MARSVTGGLWGSSCMRCSSVSFSISAASSFLHAVNHHCALLITLSAMWLRKHAFFLIQWVHVVKHSLDWLERFIKKTKCTLFVQGQLFGQSCRLGIILWCAVFLSSHFNPPECSCLLKALLSIDHYNQRGRPGTVIECFGSTLNSQKLNCIKAKKDIFLRMRVSPTDGEITELGIEEE